MDRWDAKLREIQDSIWQGIDSPPREATDTKPKIPEEERDLVFKSSVKSVEERIWAKLGTPPPGRATAKMEDEPLVDVLDHDEEDLPPIPTTIPDRSTPPPIPRGEERTTPPFVRQQERPTPPPIPSVVNNNNNRKKTPPQQQQQQQERPTPPPIPSTASTIIINNSNNNRKKTPPQQQQQQRRRRKQQQQQHSPQKRHQSPAMRVSSLQRALNDIFHREGDRVPNVSIDRVREEFMKYDKDRTGVVDSSIFRKVIQDRLGWKISERAYKRLVSRLDSSKRHDRVDYTEFQAALAMSTLSLHRETKTIKTPSPLGATATKKDHTGSSKNKSSSLTPTQRIARLKRILREMLHSQHIRYSEVSMRRVRDAFVSLDTRKRGYVTRPQFERALRFNLKWNNISNRTLESLYKLIEDEEEQVDYTIFQAALAMLTRQSVSRPTVAALASASKAVEKQQEEQNVQDQHPLSGAIASAVR